LGTGEDEFGHAAPVLEHNNAGNLHMLELQQPPSPSSMGDASSLQRLNSQLCMCQFQTKTKYFVKLIRIDIVVV
jgi:hypothetical protein